MTIETEAYEFEGERFVKLSSELGATMDVTEAEYARLTAGPEIQVIREPGDLAGYLLAGRRSLWLSQAAFAELYGLVQHQVSVWESGRNEPGVRGAIRIAHALGCDLALVPRGGTP